MNKRSASILFGLITSMSNHYQNQDRTFKTQRHERSAAFIAESKQLAEAKRQRRCERNLRLIQR